MQTASPPLVEASRAGDFRHRTESAPGPRTHETGPDRFDDTLRAAWRDARDRPTAMTGRAREPHESVAHDRPEAVSGSSGDAPGAPQPGLEPDEVQVAHVTVAASAETEGDDAIVTTARAGGTPVVDAKGSTSATPATGAQTTRSEVALSSVPVGPTAGYDAESTARTTPASAVATTETTHPVAVPSNGEPSGVNTPTPSVTAERTAAVPNGAPSGESPAPGATASSSTTMPAAGSTGQSSDPAPRDDKSDRRATAPFRALEHNSERGRVPLPAAGRVTAVEQGLRLEQDTGITARPVTLLTASALGETGAPTAVVSSGAATDSAAEARGLLHEDRAFTGRVVRGLSAMVNQRGGAMTMRLDPPELGRLRIDMQIQRGTVTARFLATSVAAGQLLERNLASLRTALEGKGLTVDRLTVQVQPGGPSTVASAQPGDQGQASSDHDAGGRESRGHRHRDEAARRDEPSGPAFDSLVENETATQGAAP